MGAHELDHVDIDQGPLVGKMVGAKLVMLAEQAPPEEFVVVKSLFLEFFLPIPLSWPSARPVFGEFFALRSTPSAISGHPPGRA